MPSYESALEQEESNSLAPVIEAHRYQLSTEPDNPDLHYRLGMLSMSLGELHQGEKAFRQALAINPTFDHALTKMIICLYETNRAAEGLKLLKPPCEIDTNMLDLHYKTAVLYCDRPKFASSLMNLEHFMEQSLTMSQATHNISIVLQNLGLLDRVTATWENLGDTADRAAYTDPFGPQNAF